MLMGFILQWDSSILVGRCLYSKECFITTPIYMQQCHLDGEIMQTDP